MVYKYPRVCWIVSVRRFEVSPLSLMRFLCDPISVPTACSRFTVRIPGKCLSLAWTPAAPSDFMQKDKWSLSRCAQVLMRYVHGSFGLLFQEPFITWNIICVRPDLNLFCPFFFFLQNKKMIKLIWRNYSTLHWLLIVISSSSPSVSHRLYQRLQRHIPCLYLKKEKHGRKREQTRPRTASPSYRGRPNWEESIQTTAWMSLFYCKHKKIISALMEVLHWMFNIAFCTFWKLLSIRTLSSSFTHSEVDGLLSSFMGSVYASVLRILYFIAVCIYFFYVLEVNALIISSTLVILIDLRLAKYPWGHGPVCYTSSRLWLISHKWID